MSLIHLSDEEFIQTMKRNASGQPPWFAAHPEDVLRLIALYETAQARVDKLEQINRALTSDLEMAHEDLRELEFEKKNNPNWQRRIEEKP